MKDIQAFVFDLDGVIVDTARFHFYSWRALATELGFDVPDALNHDLKGLGRMESLELVMRHAPDDLTTPDLEALAARKNAIYQDQISHLDANELLPGVLNFLMASKSAGLKIALGSGSRNARMILDRIELSGVFDAICDGSDITRSKPDPEVFECACKRLGVAPQNAVIFEDAVSGIRAAHACGAMAVGIGDPAILREAEIVMTGLDQSTPEEILQRLKQPV